ncbi:efflux RND transporter periplasmic adaptor subunit [Alteromonas sp. ASW11-36]|uniref:Efflux RND transporter periplasmic adaptor subunit n=1 Tax=Alteromonas arenosi TaxID=3055817 RepID=A0ABT7SUU4_9ALTE|nr:efflux RND transporter periplasmic adaptor subunit [Alteromonas sp. ASW11-36]MDM7859935.1 efflux RND transporter periplasmic adaptor subunit [Alteromonas sp. ASW11-36]
MTNHSKRSDALATSQNTKKALGIGLATGVLLSVLGYLLLAPSHDMTGSSGDEIVGANEPLYWVAPMDPNFKRDKPGKSPMGMDLVPVYEESSANDSPGTVSIDPVTIQNLGVKTSTIKTIVPNATITAVGQVQFAQDLIQHVHSRIEGWIEVLNVRTQGDFITKGEPLYSIYSPELVNAQEEFVIALSQNNPALINAAKSRLRALAVPQSQIDSLEKTRKVSQTVTFLAPSTGFIESLNIQQGSYVKPSMTMLSIASLETVWVFADVFPSDASMLSLGQSAVIMSNDLPGKTFNAELDYIYPTLSTTTRTVQARFVVNNQHYEEDDKLSYWLKPAMYTNVHISYESQHPTGQKESVLVVPKQAVIRTGMSDRVVLALGDGKYKSIDVQLGRDFKDVFEVLDGLVEGDEIVTSAQFLIDSESSINSDFMRMAPAENSLDMNTSAWTQATVNEVLADRNMINITHGPLDAFDMMGMTMNFTLADHIALSDFKEGMKIHVEVIREPSGMFQIKTVHFVDQTSIDEDVSTDVNNSDSPPIASHQHMAMGKMDMPENGLLEDDLSAWTQATVNDIDVERRRVNLTHDYLDAFDMMGMTMDFSVADDIALSDFKTGMEIHIEVIREPSGMFQIKTVHFVDKASPDDSVGTHTEHSHMSTERMDMTNNEEADKGLSAWTQATVNEIDVERRRVNLTHGYLDAFDMMGMTMDFTVSSDIDINAFVVGETVHVEIIREKTGMFQVKTLHVMNSHERSHEPTPGGHE